MTAPRPPAVLAATAVRLVPELGQFVAGRAHARPVVHVGHPVLLLTGCYKRERARCRPADYHQARAMPLCRACAVELATGGRRVDLRPTRLDVAAWYGATIIRTADVPGGRAVIDALISAAIADGSIGLECRWYPTDQVLWPLHELVAPYRRRPGGLAEQQYAARRAALGMPHPWTASA